MNEMAIQVDLEGYNRMRKRMKVVYEGVKYSNGAVKIKIRECRKVLFKAFFVQSPGTIRKQRSRDEKPWKIEVKCNFRSLEDSIFVPLGGRHRVSTRMRTKYVLRKDLGARFIDEKGHRTSEFPQNGDGFRTPCTSLI